MSLPPVVHLELHTHDRAAASAFYAALLGWRTERIDNRWGSYHALALAGGPGGAAMAMPPTASSYRGRDDVIEGCVPDRSAAGGAGACCPPGPTGSRPWARTGSRTRAGSSSTISW